MPPRTSLKGFLATARAALTAPPSKRPSPLTFVVGNESADLDSLCSALLLAYFRTYAPPQLLSKARGAGTLHIPVCHLYRPDLALRPEFTAVLRDADIRGEDVFTLEDVLSRGDISPEETRWLLVDHNALTGSLAAPFASRVGGCVDHHADEDVVARDAEIRVIERSGSCASLVVECCAEIWEMLAQDDGDESGDREIIDDRIARLALASIMLDTAGLQEPSRTTEHDKRAVELAEARIAGPGVYDREGVFARLSALKEDLADMTFRDVLRKDYKEWRVDELGLGTSSVPRGFGYLTREKEGSGNGAALKEALANWGVERDGVAKIDLVAILTAFRDAEGTFRRELLVWGRSEVGVRAARRFEERYGGELGLTAWEGGKLDLDGGEQQLRRCWTQGSVSYSRKQLAPMLRDVLKEVSG
ncbi:exopolyphosphatase-like protein [Xylaria sp. CBS 124048]|nr:exopolyphosphatase-like protein [Xylaria sp. CBS 124048]